MRTQHATSKAQALAVNQSGFAKAEHPWCQPELDITAGKGGGVCVFTRFRTQVLDHRARLHMSSHHPFKKNKSKAGSGNTFRDDMLVIREELTRILEAERPSDRTRSKKLRSSSLPYCPLQELYLHMKGWIEPPTEPFPMMSYVTIGTMIHELLQNWVPRFAKKIKIIGLWDATSVDCKESDKACPFKSKYPIQALDHKGCPKCGRIPQGQRCCDSGPD